MKFWVINYKHWDGKVDAMHVAKEELVRSGIGQITTPVNIQEIDLESDVLLLKMLVSYSTQDLRSTVMRMVWDQHPAVKFGPIIEI